MKTGNLGDLVDLEADRERVLVVDTGADGVPWTGGRIQERARAVAGALLTRGLRRGDRVAILAANCAEYLVAALGIMQAGLVAVPVNVRLPPPTVRHVLRDSGTRLAFCDGNASDLAAGINRIALDAIGAMPPADGRRAVRPGPDEVAMLLYTSGSSGPPKGVPLTHRGHRWVIERRRRPGVDHRADRILVAAPLYHMNALALSQFSLACGSTLVLMPRFDARRYIDAIERHRCTLLSSVPPMLARVCRESGRLAATDLSSVGGIRMGSAPVTPELLARLADAFPGAKVQVAYGTTEAGPVVFGPHPEGLPTPALALGCRHPDVDLRPGRPGRRGVRPGGARDEVPRGHAGLPWAPGEDGGGDVGGRVLSDRRRHAARCGRVLPLRRARRRHVRVQRRERVPRGSGASPRDDAGGRPGLRGPRRGRDPRPHADRMGGAGERRFPRRTR